MDARLFSSRLRRRAQADRPADLLHRIDFIEKAGTGIRRIRDGARQQACPEPEFEAGRFVTVTFRPNPEVRRLPRGGGPRDGGEATGEATEATDQVEEATDQVTGQGADSTGQVTAQVTGATDQVAEATDQVTDQVENSTDQVTGEVHHLAARLFGVMSGTMSRQGLAFSGFPIR